MSFALVLGVFVHFVYFEERKYIRLEEVIHKSPECVDKMSVQHYGNQKIDQYNNWHKWISAEY